MTLNSWDVVLSEARKQRKRSLKALVKRRGTDGLLWRAPQLEVNVSRQPLSKEVLAALTSFAKERDLSGAIGDLFKGKIVNRSENRPALHWALRGGGQHLPAARVMMQEARRAGEFARRAAAGGLGFEVKTILHVGIGGSDLGPRLIWDALRDYNSRGPTVRFCANVDPEDFHEAVAGVDPNTTLVIVVSKSFRTPETAANAKLARAWLVDSLGEKAANQRLAAVSSAPDKAAAWGADRATIFAMDEAVGGRYSLWSSVGLSLQIALGEDVWTKLLAGAAQMDRHFETAPLDENTPARLAMMDVWLHSALNIPTRCVLAYAHRLRRLPDFLQQLEMESNGKSTPDTPDGLIGPTAPVTWGSVGTLGQHSFHQLLHQGMRDSAVEFVAALDAGRGDHSRGRALLANAFGQGEALLMGRSAAEAEAQLSKGGAAAAQIKQQAPHMDMPGEHGSTTILLDEMSPESVGALLALYEHRTFAAGVLWGINPFDQWGVERGKVLAEEIEAAIVTGDTRGRDPGTATLVERAHKRLGA